MRALRLGIMGCADIARRAMAPAAMECPGVTLVAAAGREAKKTREFAAHFHCEALVGYDRLLEREDIDAVYMPLPTGLHHEWVLRTLAAGKHILVEKSAAIDYASCQTLVTLAREKNLLLMENFLFPHHSQYAWIDKCITSGKLGEIHLLRSTFGFPPLPRHSFRYDKELGGGALIDAGAYVVKAATLFLGNDLRPLGAALTYDNASGVDIYGVAMFKNHDGQIAQLAFGFDYYYQCCCEFLGSKGKLVVERMFTPPPGFRPVVRMERQDQSTKITLPADNHYVNMLTFFAETIGKPEHYAIHWNDLLVQARLLESIRREAA